MNILQKYKSLNQNERIIVDNTFWAFLVKGGALVISFLTIPAFINYFDDNVILGLWYTLLSVMTWFLNFDFGIGNGIRNQLTKAFILNDECAIRKIISSGVFSISVITVILAVIGIFILFSIDLNTLFNIEESVISYSTLLMSSILVLSAILFRFLLTVVTSVFYALQKSSVNNFLAFCVSGLQLFFVLTFHFDDKELALKAISLTFFVISNLPIILAAVIVFRGRLKNCIPSIKYVNRDSTKDILHIGSIFFVCQILYMLIANTNEFLVTNFFGSQYTAEYTFYYKLTFLISMIVTLAMTPIWSVVTKAYSEKKYDWLYKLYNKVKKMGYIAVILLFLQIPILQFIMNIWLGKGVVTVDILTALSFVCFGGTFMYSGILSTIVCGMGRMKLQLFFYLIGVILKFLFVFIISKTISNWSIVVWSNVIVLLPYCIVQQIDLNRCLKKLSQLHLTSNRI